MALNIERLLDKIPERQRDTELKQVSKIKTCDLFHHVLVFSAPGSCPDAVTRV